MASLKDMRVRIASTKATQKITKAMQMVAASKLRREPTARFEAAGFALCTQVYSSYESEIAQLPPAQQINPLVVEAPGLKAGAVTSYEYQPEEDEILPRLLPRNLAVQVFRALLENNAS